MLILPQDTAIAVGETASFTVSLSGFSGVDDSAITWDVNNPGVVSLGESVVVDGAVTVVVYGESMGDAIITASADGVSASATVKVGK